MKSAKNPKSVTPVGLALGALLSLALAPCAQTTGFVKIFDGKTTKGWHIQGHAAWRAENGVLIGTHAAADSVFGHLVSDSAYGDFALRYQWKLVKGNSGLYYHSAEGGAAGMIGPQVEMDDNFPGGIYTTNTNPWGWVAQPTSEAVKTWYKPNDWNLVTVTVKGPHAAITYNGLPTAETSDARLPLRGHFGFQVHALLDCEIWVKEVELSLPVPTALGPGNALARKLGKRPDLFPGGANPFWIDLEGRYRTNRISGNAPPLAGRSR